MSTELQKTLPRQEITIDSLRPEQITRQMDLIKQVMKENMVEGQDFGVIPGCGDKPSLFKAGAEKLRLLFFLSPQFDWASHDMGNGHMEFEFSCTLTQINTGKIWGQGVGSCSTMEAKYRYRYEGYGVDRKRVENQDIADQYNTVRKMAKKRAFVDAILTATSASAIFTQDVEDLRQKGDDSDASPARAEGATTVLLVPPDDEGVQVWRATVSKVATKSGHSQKSGKPWSLVSLLLPGDASDYWVSTFDKKLGVRATTFDGKLCDVTVKPGNKEGQWDLLAIEAPKDQAKQAPEQTHEATGDNNAVIPPDDEYDPNDD